MVNRLVGIGHSAFRAGPRTQRRPGVPSGGTGARAETDRIGARRPGRAGELTLTERRVAELAASGRSNKEIARALFVTVHTVEGHLSRAYAKLGIRSRAQLASLAREDWHPGQP